MLSFSVLVVFLVVLPGRGHSEPRTVSRRYKPIIQVTEEIDINDITFTTSAPQEFERSSSQRTAAYYNGIKPLDKGYGAGQAVIVPAGKYKPYKVFKVQDGFRAVPYKAKVHEKSKLVAFDPATAFGGPEASKQNAKVVPFSSPLPAKAPPRVPTFPQQENKNFIPSPTFSPTVLALINNENNHKFTEGSDAGSFTPSKTVEWPVKPTKKIYRIKTPKKLPESTSTPAGDDFPPTSSDKVQDTVPHYNFQKDTPQESESFLSEISTLHKDGSASNNLDGVADSLDLKTGERVEFQMYGMDGPQSYKFGFDTGKGHNRHFRFEERDNTGKVKGHYGYLDEDGKMRIMKYEADPVTGFHAGPVEISPDDN